MAVFRLFLGAAPAPAAGEIYERIHENGDDWVTEDGLHERVNEQELPVETGANASLSATVGPATVASSGALRIAGSLSVSLGGASLSATGTVAAPTAINFAAAVREALITTVPAATISGVVREVLLATATTLTVSGLAREILLVGDPGGQGALSAAVGPATLSATGELSAAPIGGTLSVTLGPVTLSASGLASAPISGSLSATVGPASLTAEAGIEIAYRVTENYQDRVSEDDADERITEQFMEGYARLEVTLQPATVTIFSGETGRAGIVDPLYLRVTERSPSTLHPAPGGDTLEPAPIDAIWHRVTERSLARVPDEIDYRILQHQLLGTLRLSAFTATVRVHVAERHFLWASRARIECVAARSRIQLRARSDYRKTRANG